MKATRKILAILVAAMLLVSLLPAALATGTPTTPTTPTTFTITAPNNTHTYEIYQIFTGDLAEGVLSNVLWGTNGTGTKDTEVDDATLTALEAVNNPGKSDTEKLAVIQNYVNLSSPAFLVGGEGEARTDSVVVPAGYYLIKDVDGALAGTNEAYTKFIVSVVKDITINPKTKIPTMTKKVQDANDTTGVTSGWQDSADYDIGDQVPFQLTGVVADNYADYASYYFAFHDVEEQGLEYVDGSAKVYIDGAPITSGYTVNTSTDDGCSFEVIFSDLKLIKNENDAPIVHAGSKITVDYKSTLTSAAVIGDEGNVNKARLEFSNNPNQVQGGTPETGFTPWDNVIVFTYMTIINKVAENPNYNPSDDNSQQYIPLSGAEFTLEKKVGSDWIAVTGAKNNEGTSFTFAGLDDGNYRLTETKAPDGYNKIDPIEFSVTADHAIEWDGTNRTDVLVSIAGNKVTGKITFIPDKEAGLLSADILNQAGATLPTTGGVGTTLFYVIGSILVVGAVVLLVSKKRMNAID